MRDWLELSRCGGTEYTLVSRTSGESHAGSNPVTDTKYLSWKISSKNEPERENITTNTGQW